MKTLKIIREERIGLMILMGENHELKNRYMLVNAPEEWTKEASTEQVQDKYRTSVGQV